MRSRSSLVCRIVRVFSAMPAVIAFVSGLGVTLVSAGDPAPLLPVVPGAANAIVVIDVEALLATPLSARHHWANQAALEYAERPVLVPGESSAVAIAASLDMENDLQVQWQVAVAQMRKRLEVPKIAVWEGGYADRIAGVDVAWTPSRCYVAELPEQRLAIISPANRQATARWLERQQSGEAPQISAYLRQAAMRANNRSQIVFAVDLKHAIAPHRLQELVEESPTLFQKADQRTDVREKLSGLLGVTLLVSVSNHADGELRFDFDSAPKAGPLAKPLILEALDRHNLHLEEVEAWSVKTDGNSLVLDGRLTPEGLRRIGSLLQLPTTKFSDLESAQPAAPGAPDYTLRSQQYFRAVSALIDDLNKTLKENRDNHAVWMERYGQKVDALPILNVDDELLSWGASVGETFRTMALAQRSAGIRQGVRKSSVYGSYTDANGYYTNRPVANERNEIRRQEDAQASKVRFESWKEVEDSRAAIRRTMTQKYGVEF